MNSTISNSPERWTRRRALLPWAGCVLAGMLAGVHASAQDAQRSTQSLAFVGAEAITQADVDLQLGRSASGSATEPELAPLPRWTTVHLIALQRQALRTLRRMKQAATEEEIDQWLESHPFPAEQRRAVGEQALRELIGFRLSWRRYLAKHMTDTNLRKHFSNQPRRFDGTQFTLEMASIEVPPGDSPARRQARGKLAALRQRLANDAHALERVALGEEDWEWMARRTVSGTGELDPTLITGLLKLQEGEFSEPIDTATGVHLIHLIESTPGDRRLEDVAGEVRAHMLFFLLEHLAAQSASELPLRSAP